MENERGNKHRQKKSGQCERLLRFLGRGLPVAGC